MRKLDFVKLVLPGIFCLALFAQNCAPPPSSSSNDTTDIGGLITGLTGTLVLQNNGADEQSISSPEDFYFYEVEVDSAYDIAIKTQPSGQTCTFTNDNNTGIARERGVDNIDIVCTNNNKIIFVTTATRNGDFGGISGTDLFCMEDANKPNSSTYKALIVGGTTRVACTTENCGGGTTEHTDWVLAPNTVYVQSDGTTMIGTTNSSGIFTFPLDNAFTGTSDFIWTGLNADWTTSTSVCLNGMSMLVWNTSSGGSSGTFGDASQLFFSVISDGTQTCSDILHLACVEQ